MQTLPFVSSDGGKGPQETPHGRGYAHHIFEQMAADSTLTENGGGTGQTHRPPATRNVPLTEIR